MRFAPSTLCTVATLCVLAHAPASAKEPDGFDSLRARAMPLEALKEEIFKAVFDCRCSPDEFEERECRQAQPVSVAKLKNGALAVMQVTSDELMLGTYDFAQKRFPLKVEPTIHDQRWVDCAQRDDATGQPREADCGASQVQNVLDVAFSGGSLVGLLEVDEGRAKRIRTGAEPMVGELIFRVARFDREEPPGGDEGATARVQATVLGLRLWVGARELGGSKDVVTFVSGNHSAAQTRPLDGRRAAPPLPADSGDKTIDQAPGP